MLTTYMCIPYFPSAYQEDLGSISSQIQTLQEQSLSMNIKLKNRQVSKKHLFIDFLSHKSSEELNSNKLVSFRGLHKLWPHPDWSLLGA